MSRGVDPLIENVLSVVLRTDRGVSFLGGSYWRDLLTGGAPGLDS
jgi:hypothetical protein